MGNGQVFQHRLPALSVASFVTLALALSYGAAFTCSFLEVTNKNPQVGFFNHTNDAHSGGTTTDHNNLYSPLPDSFCIGLLCKSPFYSRSEDRMWVASRILVILALVVGTASSLLGWAISTFVRPTNTNWLIMSILSALSGVLQTPTFFLFCSKPCTAFEGQSCGLSVGCFLLIFSTFCYVCVLVVTQMFERPQWAEVQHMQETNQKRDGLGLIDDDSIDDHDRDLLAAEEGIKSNDICVQQHSPIRKFKKNGPWRRRRWSRKSCLDRLNHVCAMADDGDVNEECKAKGNATVYDQRLLTVPAWDEKGSDAGIIEGTGDALMSKPNTNTGGSEYAQSMESQLMVNVGPNGKVLGDETKSGGTFSDDLGEEICLAEKKRHDQLYDGHSISVSSASSTKLTPTSPHTPSVSSILDESSSHEASTSSPAQFAPAVLAANGISLHSNPRSMSFTTLQVADNLLKEFPQVTGTAESSENRRNSSPSCPPFVPLSLGDKKASLRDAAFAVVPWRKNGPKRNREKKLSLHIKQEYELFEDVDSTSAATSREGAANLWALFDQSELQGRPVDSAYDDDDGIVPPPPPRPLKKTLLATENSEKESVGILDELFSPEGDLDILREAAIAGAIAALKSNEMGSDPDPEPQYYSSDESTSTLSLSSFHSKQSNLESFTCTDNTSSESEGDDPLARCPSGSPALSLRSGSKRLRTPRKKKSRRSRQMSAGGSACSNSLLDTTIDEETDQDLEVESGSGDEDNYESNAQMTDKNDEFNKIMGRLVTDFTSQGKTVSSIAKAISPNSDQPRKSREPNLSKCSAYEEGYLSRRSSTPRVSPSPSKVSSALKKAKQKSQRKEKYISMEDTHGEESESRAMFTDLDLPRESTDRYPADDDGIEGSRDSGNDERQESRGARPRRTRIHSKSSLRGRFQVVPITFPAADEDTGLNVGSDEVSLGSAHYPVIKVPSNPSSWREREIDQSGVHYDDSEAIVSDHSEEGIGRSSRSRSLLIREARKRKLQIQRQHSIDSHKQRTTTSKVVNIVCDYESDEASL